MESKPALCLFAARIAMADLAQPGLFLRRWLANPAAVGSPTPSVPQVGRIMARGVNRAKDRAVVEIGAGTGAVTAELLAAGIAKDRLFVIEIDHDMCVALRERFPDVNVIEGDCARLADLLPAEWRGKVATVVSGIPMTIVPAGIRRRMIDSIFDVLVPGGNMLQLTFSWFSPLPRQELALKGAFFGRTWRNVPPASVWNYTRA